MQKRVRRARQREWDRDRRWQSGSPRQSDFYPDAERGNTSAHRPSGAIDAQGRFEVYLPEARKGAPPGWYKVVVHAVDDPQPGKPNKYLVHKKYSNHATTPLSMEVVRNPEPGRYDLKLDR